MIDEQTAEELGWTLQGVDAEGNQVFSLVDEGGDLITWRLSEDGQAFDVRNESQEQRDTETFLDSTAPVSALAAGDAGNGADAGQGVSTPQKDEHLANVITDETAAEIGWTPAGNDSDGNQRFTLIDEGGDLISWSIDPATGHAIGLRNESQEKRDADAAAIAAAAAHNSPLIGGGGSETVTTVLTVTSAVTVPAVVGVDTTMSQVQTPQNPAQPMAPSVMTIISPFWDDTHRAIGGGRYMLIDRGGDVIAFDEDGGNIANLGPATADAATTAAALLSKAQPTFTASLFSDDTWRAIGGGRYMLIDQGGDIIAFDEDGGNIVNLGPATADAPTTAASLLAREQATFTVSLFSDDTWREIGGGRYMLIDQGGDIIAFNADGSGIQNLGRANAHAADVAANLLAQFNASRPSQVVITPQIVTPGTITPPLSGGGSTASPFWDDTHRLIGETSAGPLYMLVDQGGSIITWIDAGNGQASNVSNQGRATQGAAATATQLGAQFRAANPPGGGGTTTSPRPGAPGVNLPPGGVSSIFNPTHRLVGYTRAGYEVYQLTDEGGNLVEWYDVPGQGAQGQHYLSGPNDSTSYVFTTGRPQMPRNTTGGESGNNWDKTAIIVAFIGAAGLWIASRREKKT